MVFKEPFSRFPARFVSRTAFLDNVSTDDIFISTAEINVLLHKLKISHNPHPHPECKLHPEHQKQTLGYGLQIGPRTLLGVTDRVVTSRHQSPTCTTTSRPRFREGLRVVRPLQTHGAAQTPGP